MEYNVWGNPFTHEEHSRTTYSKEDLDQEILPFKKPRQTCAWCGQRNRFDGLFEYDNSGVLVCSKVCHKTYFNL